MAAPPSAPGGGATGNPIPLGLPPEGGTGSPGSAIAVASSATKWSFVGCLRQHPLILVPTPTPTPVLVLELEAPKITSFYIYFMFLKS